MSETADWMAAVPAMAAAGGALLILALDAAARIRIRLRGTDDSEPNTDLKRLEEKIKALEERLERMEEWR